MHIVSMIFRRRGLLWLAGFALCLSIANCGGGGSGASTIPEARITGLSLMAGDIGGDGSIDGTGSTARFSEMEGVALDASGNIYVADTSTHKIRIITPAGVVTTLAGTAGNAGSADGTGPAALFSFPRGITADGAGNLYVADTFNHTIRQIVIATGVVTTLAGTAGVTGGADGTGAAAEFFFPSSITFDGAGNLFVADTENATIRQIVIATGAVTTLAGTAGVTGSTDGTGGAAEFDQPRGITADGAGNLYVADTENHTIRKIVIATGEVTTPFGTAGVDGVADGTGVAAEFSFPRGITAEGSTNLYVADTNSNTIRKIVIATEEVTTLVDAAAGFSIPAGIATDISGNVYVGDRGNFVIRKVAAGGAVSTVAGMMASFGSVDGVGAAARFVTPFGIARDAFGNLYVADQIDSTIRKLDSAGGVTTLAGVPSAVGAIDGPGATAQFNLPTATAVDDASGNLYVADMNNSTIRQIVLATGEVTTLAGSAGINGAADGTGGAALFSRPSDITADGAGNLFVSDLNNHTIRQIVIATGVVTTLAGTALSPGDTDGTGLAAQFALPRGVTADGAGNLYVADTDNQTIRKIVIATGEVTTLAGTAGVTGSADGTGGAAQFNQPQGITTDGAGNVYVADMNNHTIRKIVAATGVVTTVAGVAGESGVRLGDLPGYLNFPRKITYMGDNTLAVTTAQGVVRIVLP